MMKNYVFLMMSWKRQVQRGTKCCLKNQKNVIIIKKRKFTEDKPITQKALINLDSRYERIRKIQC
jgi:hypothetical protein